MDKFDVDHHQSILSRPEDTWLLQDKQLIDKTLLRPAVEDIKRLTGVCPEGAFQNAIGTPIWDEIVKNPVPQFLCEEEDALQYLRRILAITRKRYKKRGDLLRMVRAHPHYFWRVPSDLYQHSLATDDCQNPSFKTFLDIIIAASHRPELWAPDDDLGPLLEFIKKSLEEAHPEFSAPLLYTYQRVVATGQANVPTHSVLDMFAILGPDEWRARAEAVREQLITLEKNGE